MERVKNEDENRTRDWNTDEIKPRSEHMPDQTYNTQSCLINRHFLAIKENKDGIKNVQREVKQEQNKLTPFLRNALTFLDKNVIHFHFWMKE